MDLASWPWRFYTQPVAANEKRPQGAGTTICFRRTAMGTEAKQCRLQTNNDKVARWLLGDNAAEGTVRLLVLILAYIVSSILVLDWLMR